MQLFTPAQLRLPSSAAGLYKTGFIRGLFFVCVRVCKGLGDGERREIIFVKLLVCSQQYL